MAEAVILGLTKKLEIWASRHEKNLRTRTMEEIFHELKLMVDFLTHKKLGEGSRHPRPQSIRNYLIDNVVKMVQDILDLNLREIFFSQYSIGTSTIDINRDSLRVARKLMINSGEDWDQLPLTIKIEDVVGLEEDVKVLRGEIFNKEKSLRILLVGGLPGIGKTALARKVYKESTANIDRFKCCVWVRLSSDLTNEDAIIKIMQQVVGSSRLQRDSLLGIQSLQQMLRRQLQGMPYFIVVDNLQKGTRFYESVLQCLPDEGYGSRVLLTSRSYSYLDITPWRKEERVDYFHKMKALGPDESWKLFMNTVKKFTSDEEQYKFPKHLERKGKEMMMKACGGLPVAIIDVGRQIAKQRLEKGIEWEELLEIDSIDWSATLELLEVRYRELDEKHQKCFLYMAFFKENTIIRAKMLKHIWVAIGGFHKHYDVYFLLTLYDEFFVELVDKSYPRKQNCRINPLLHRLSTELAEKEIGLEILRNFDGHSNRASSQTGPRHRIVHCSRDNEFNHYHSTEDIDKHLVSLIFRGGGAYLDDAEWKRFELLKMLDLEGFGIETLSETVGTTLKELKLLGLRNNYMEKIPRSLGCLKELEVLDISQNFMVEVPDTIWEMSSLHHLYMSDVICVKPLKIDTLEHMETLAYISVYDFLGMGMETMRNIKRLGIEEVDENSDVSKLFASRAKLGYIYNLTLRGFRFRSMPCLDEVGVLVRLHTLKLEGLLAGLPSAFPPVIKDLSLVNSCLDEDPMPVLEKMYWLTHLKLQNAYTGRQMVIRRDGFRILEVLHIKELWNLRNLKLAQVGVKVDAMERLEKLEIDNCPYLDTLPHEIWRMDSLKELKMVTTKNIATKIRKSSGLIPKGMVVDITP